MERLLWPSGLHHDACGEARRARQRRLLSRLRQAPAARRGLLDPGAAVRACAAGREPDAAAEPRARGAGRAMPRAVSLGLQPLQNTQGRETAAGVSRVVLALMWLVHWLPLRVIAWIGN